MTIRDKLALMKKIKQQNDARVRAFLESQKQG